MQGNGEGAKPKPVLCAGQGCEERKTCMRYRWSRSAGVAWVSWDIERQHFKGGCPGYIEATFVRSKARH